MRITKKHIDKALLICKNLNISCKVTPTDIGSEVDVLNRTITIDLNEVKGNNSFYSILFHEIGHIWCFENKKFYKYHTDNGNSKYMRRIGLKAERYVDTIGKNLMKESLPNIEFINTYEDESDILWYKDWLNKTYPI